VNLIVKVFLKFLSRYPLPVIGRVVKPSKAGRLKRLDLERLRISGRPESDILAMVTLNLEFLKRPMIFCRASSFDSFDNLRHFLHGSSCFFVIRLGSARDSRNTR